VDTTLRSVVADRLTHIAASGRRFIRLRRAPLGERRPISRPLAAYTAAIIVIGFGLLAVVTAVYPLDTHLVNAGIPVVLADTSVNALIFWIAVGLLGATRARTIGGGAVLTFHLPFIVAAMTLGGPVAAGWVGAISTLELRELRVVPWFGTLFNHAVAALAGIVGGVIGVLLRVALARVVDPQAATFAAALCAAFVFCAINVALMVVTVAAREQLAPAEAAAVFDRSFRRTTIAEVVIGWVLAISYQVVAWWAPIVCSILVLTVWRANDEHELTTHDAMTGLLNRRGFELRWAQTADRVRRGRQRAALVMVDLDGFKAINDTYGHAAGDEVIRVAGKRLRTAVRYTDAAARLGGDEFAVLLLGVPGADAAQRVVGRIHESLCLPVSVATTDDIAMVPVGASLGLVYLDPETAATARDVADMAMYEAKRRGGGVEVAAVT
jgi:diguanylate cyclase (GGDEF)-like protein